jgi:protein TonB
MFRLERRIVGTIRRGGWLLAAVLLATGARGQDLTPMPDSDGVYLAYGDVKAARLLHAVAAAYPADAKLAQEKHVSTLDVVIGADGVPAKIDVIGRSERPFDDAAIAAVRQSQFAPGTLEGKPVPVRITVWVPFTGADHPAEPESGELGSIANMTAPKPLKWAEAEFSEQARRERKSGSVLVSMLISEEGEPTSVSVVVPLGSGLDEEALKAARQYRFKPATLEGMPIPARIMIEVSFRLRGYRG